MYWDHQTRYADKSAAAHTGVLRAAHIGMLGAEHIGYWVQHLPLLDGPVRPWDLGIELCATCHVRALKPGMQENVTRHKGL